MAQFVLVLSQADNDLVPSKESKKKKEQYGSTATHVMDQLENHLTHRPRRLQASAF